jgi:hypothetical protein
MNNVSQLSNKCITIVGNKILKYIVGKFSSKMTHCLLEIMIQIELKVKVNQSH